MTNYRKRGDNCLNTHTQAAARKRHLLIFALNIESISIECIPSQYITRFVFILFPFLYASSDMEQSEGGGEFLFSLQT